MLGRIPKIVSCLGRLWAEAGDPHHHLQRDRLSPRLRPTKPLPADCCGWRIGLLCEADLPCDGVVCSAFFNSQSWIALQTSFSISSSSKSSSTSTSAKFADQRLFLCVRMVYLCELIRGSPVTRYNTIKYDTISCNTAFLLW